MHMNFKTYLIYHYFIELNKRHHSVASASNFLSKIYLLLIVRFFVLFLFACFSI